MKVDLQAHIISSSPLTIDKEFELFFLSSGICRVISSAVVDASITRTESPITSYLQGHGSIGEMAFPDVAVGDAYFGAVGEVPVQDNARNAGATQDVEISLIGISCCLV